MPAFQQISEFARTKLASLCWIGLLLGIVALACNFPSMLSRPPGVSEANFINPDCWLHRLHSRRLSHPDETQNHHSWGYSRYTRADFKTVDDPDAGAQFSMVPVRTHYLRWPDSSAFPWRNHPMPLPAEA
jgi:hypothetical protein